MRTIYIMALLSLSFISCNKQEGDSEKETTQERTSDFFWKADSLGEVYFEHSTMLLPVKFNAENKDSGNYYLSFYPGHNSNHMYSDFAQRIGKVISNKDSTSYSTFEINDVSGYVGDIRFNTVTFPVSERPSGVSDSIVGEVSLDFFTGNHVLINFRDQAIQLYDDLSAWSGYDFQPYEIYLNHKIILTVSINKAKYPFLFNPHSALFVMFNPENPPGPVSIGDNTWNTPDTRQVNDANPYFEGILGYAFLKDKIVIIAPDKQQICISDKMFE
ncbi:MAG: hypothetical protein U9Q98_05685 [Bacteroidota bacterium]|nr:hypothetical protein [Bacteroidota bacterium]